MTTKTTATKATEDSSTRRWRATIDDLLRQRAEVAERIADLSRTKGGKVLPARTGDAEAAADVARINQEIAGLHLELEDVEAALEAARAELEAAEAVEAAGRERERLERVRDLAEQRVQVAAEVEERARALGEVLARYDAVGAGIRRELKPAEDGKARATVGAGRVTLTLAHHLGVWIDQPGRFNKRGEVPFADRERQALHALLLSDVGVVRLAEVAAA